MGNAFTPGLTISPNVTIRKTRLLPIKGEVVLKVGEIVTPETIVAKVDLPGTLAVVKAAAQLGCAAEQLSHFCLVKEGELVKNEQVIATRKLFFNLITNNAKSTMDGTVEYISKLSGNIGIRGKVKPIACHAYISGKVVEIIENEGVIIETQGSLIQGIFGIGSERHGNLAWIDVDGDTLTAKHLNASHQNKIIMTDSRIDGSVLTAATELGVIGIIGASIIDSELMSFLGYDIGVAVTGEEKTSFTLIVTEGFGKLNMPERSRNLMKSLDGKYAAINGATQIRAGVIRPELIVPNNDSAVAKSISSDLKVGTRVRLIRRPYFGAIGNISVMHEQPIVIKTGSSVRVVSIKLEDGSQVTVPRANIEILD